MNQINTKPRRKTESHLTNGRDEMNLAEFPFASLRSRGDRRKSITYEGWVVDGNGDRCHQKWIVRGLADLGLPTEFDERTFVALMAITAMQGYKNRKASFSIYQILKIMGLNRSQRSYQNVENSLDRLVGVTIKSERAFWDNGKRERITTVKAFHLIEEYWLRYKENDEAVRESEGVPGYIIWGETIWNSFKANYIKNLDLVFFYSLQSPTARRLYRFLDKRMQYQQMYEIDILDLANRLGMVRYRKPADVKRKFQSAFDELIAQGFLKSAKVVKYKRYTRIRFVKAPRPLPKSVEEPAEEEAQEDQETYQSKRLAELRERYGITPECIDTWDEALTEIEGATTRNTFLMWFGQTHLLSLKDGTAIIGVPNSMAKEWLEERLHLIIKRALEGATDSPIEKLIFQVLERPQKVLEQ